MCPQEWCVMGEYDSKLIALKKTNGIYIAFVNKCSFVHCFEFVITFFNEF